MKLYTERHGIRAPREKTYLINRDMYSLLFDCCKRFIKCNIVTICKIMMTV